MGKYPKHGSPVNQYRLDITRCVKVRGDALLAEFDRASDAVAYAVAGGFEKTYYYEEGLGAWKAAGYPIEKGN